jgi:hypothetical protein
MRKNKRGKNRKAEKRATKYKRKELQSKNLY